MRNDPFWAAYKFFRNMGNQPKYAAMLARAENTSAGEGWATWQEWDDAYDWDNHVEHCPEARRNTAQYSDGRTMSRARRKIRGIRGREQAGYEGYRSDSLCHCEPVGVILYDRDYEDAKAAGDEPVHLASLWGIDDRDDCDYMRLVAAELACEAIGEREHMAAEAVKIDRMWAA